MDCRKLIKLINERKALWDRNHSDYHDRNKILMLWMEVSNELNEKYELVRARWRGLRDNFRKELSKVNEGNQSKWCHFESMLFLKDHTNKQNNDNSQPFEQPDSVQSNDGVGFEIIKLEPNLDEENSSKSYFETAFESIDSESMIVNGIGTKSDFNLLPVGCDPNIANTTEFLTEQSSPISGAASTIELQTLTDISKNHVDIFSENFQQPVTGTVNYNNNIIDTEKINSLSHSNRPANNNNNNNNNNVKLKSTFVSNNLPAPSEETKKPAKRKRKINHDVDQTFPLETDKLNIFKTHINLQNDSNYHFLMSILPELQKIPPDRQLLTRIKIQELLLEEQKTAR